LGQKMIRNSIIIPSYNEERGIEVVLNRVLQIIDDTFEVIVVNDGSKDGTGEVARKFDIRVIDHDENRGKGVAMRTGIKNASGENIIFIDADNTYPAGTIKTITDELQNGNDMVVASRLSGEVENIPFFNQVGNKVFKLMFKYVYGAKTSDPLSGLYGIKKAHLLNMDLVSAGFEIETEITIKAARMGLDIKDIPIVYGERIGEVKLDPIKDGYKIFRTLLSLITLYNPSLVFVMPGTMLSMAGVALMIILQNQAMVLGGVSLGIHTFIFASLLTLVGFQIVISGVTVGMYAVAHKFCEEDVFVRLYTKETTTRIILLVGMLFILMGSTLGLRIAGAWVSGGFGIIHEIQQAVLSATLIIIGIQVIFASIYLKIFINELRSK